MTASEDSDPAAAGGCPAAAESIPETGDAPALAWLPVIAGLLAATAVAWFVQPGPLARLSFLTSLVAVFFWLATTAAAGAAGMALCRLSLLGRRAGLPPAQCLLGALPAWILLPPLLLLSERRSPWALAFVSLAAAALAVGIFERLPRATLSAGIETNPGLFAGLPPPEAGRPQTVLISASIEGALALLIGRHWLPGGALLAVGSFLLAGRIVTASIAKAQQNLQRSEARAGAAAMLALVFLLPLLITGGRGFLGGAGEAAQASRRPAVTAKAPADVPEDGYRGIILWPVPPREEPLVAPTPPTPALSAHRAKPLVIPFDGDYWYFQAPRHDPGVHPHLAHGDPVKVSIFSASWIPLAMQAHQSLAAPVDLTCCGRLELTVENGDNRQGEIAMAVVLRDTTRKGKPFLFLAPQTLVSTEPSHFFSKAHPVDEVLTFPIPRRSPIRQFDQITVIYFPSEARATLGARVSVRQFELVPR